MNLLSSWEGEGGIFFGIIYKYNEKWQITDELVVKWLGKVWERGRGCLLKKRGMLVLDHFKSHVTEKVKTF
jgi:hypothetical protein